VFASRERIRLEKIEQKRKKEEEKLRLLAKQKRDAQRG
jgi:hypothetical protein